MGNMIDFVKFPYRILQYLKKKSVYSREYKNQKASLADVFKNQKENTLFITNNYKGGTNFYNENVIQQYPNVVLLQPISYMKDLYFKVSGNESSVLLKEEELNSLFEKNYKNIIINSLVNYNCVYKINNLINAYKKKNPKCYIKCNIHDFHSVCPQKNLLYNNQYCGLNCNKNNCRFYLPAEFTYPVSNIEEWRESWRKIYEIANNIECFSNSSKEILTKIYGEELGEKITVYPHDWVKTSFSSIQTFSKELKVGIIGNCNNIPKGKRFIKKIIKNRNKNIPIVMIGTKRRGYGFFNPNVKFLGPYEQAKLQQIIEDMGINCIVFTSIWPETYSFVLSEIFSMNLPVICLDVGAQGERVKNYKNGFVCSSEEAVIETINKMYLERSL